MDSNDTALLAVIAKQLRELRDGLAKLARLPGPRGDDGKHGRDGKDGVRGADGRNGERGPAGPRGPRGEPGKDGADGERGPAPDHQWKGTRLRFQKPDGAWGKYVELRGAKGEPGASGGGWSGGAAGNGWSPDNLPAATDDLPNGFMVRQGDTWTIASYEQMATWLGGTPTPGPTTGILTEGGDYLTTEGGDALLQE